MVLHLRSVWVIQDSKFGNNQAMKPNEPNFLVDPGYYTENVVHLRGIGYGNVKEWDSILKIKKKIRQ